jgi:hypothetical protein
MIAIESLYPVAHVFLRSALPWKGYGVCGKEKTKSDHGKNYFHGHGLLHDFSIPMTEI